MSFTVNNGDIWDALLANAALTTTPDGQTDLPGHTPKIIDNWLDDGPSQIKARFYNWYNNFQITSPGGLTLDYDSGIILDDTGITPISSGQLILPDNSTYYVVVDQNLTINYYDDLPNRCYPLAIVETSGGFITSIVDIREQVTNKIQNLGAFNAFVTGDIKFTTRKSIDAGWLLCDGRYIDPTVYSGLFNILGYSYGQQGSLFRLPLGGKTIRSSENFNDIGQYVGSDQVILNPNQMPRHTHDFIQNPHNHPINDAGHSHGSYNLNHSHGVNQSPHGHAINDPGHNHTRDLVYRSTRISGFTNDHGAELSSAGNQTPGMISAFTGVSVQNNTVPLSISNTNLVVSTHRRSANISVNNTTINASNGFSGNNQPVDIVPASIILNMWIKI